MLCPAHDDNTPSLDIDPGDVQPVVMTCRAGCTTDAVMAAVGVSWDALMEEDPRLGTQAEWTPRGPAVAVYDYRDEHGALLSQVLRTADKQFSQRVPDASTKTGFRWSLRDTRRVLYRLPEVLAAIETGQEVICVEGEKDADRLVREGFCATTSIGGAGKWRPEYSDTLRDSQVTIVADKDERGQEHARAVRESLLSSGCRVQILESASGKDASDHFAAGLKFEDFVVTVPYEDDSRELLAANFDEYLLQRIDERVMVIPNCLARGEVVIITAGEGTGKTTMMKQFAVQVAYGIHPWAANPRMTPRKVLYIDAENSAADNLEDFKSLARRAQAITTEHAPLYIIESGPIDLLREDFSLWLLERVRAHDPDLLLIGPIYNIISAVREEHEARALMVAIQAAQKINGCAVIMEHHAPHGDALGRDLRPIGSSLLRRWPNFGFGIAPERDEKGKLTDSGLYDLTRWRMGRRRNRQWPVRMRTGQGMEFPWVEADPV